MKYEPWLWDERPNAPEGFIPAWWWMCGGNDPCDLPPAVFDRLTGGELLTPTSGRCYPTREEALQDLAQAEASK